MRYLSILIFLFCTSCVAYYGTGEHSFRVKNPKTFKYNKDYYNKFRVGLIDTNCIYVFTYSYSDYNGRQEAEKGSNENFIRFFGGGQVLFFYNEKKEPAEIVNNRNEGIPGYFIAKGTKLKVDRFEIINGGQTGKVYGRILKNGDLLLFKQRPETYFGLFWLLEKADGSSYSVWKKTSIESLINYRPDW
jgi:hypothetical protein